jgi:cell division protein FtsZ
VFEANDSENFAESVEETAEVRFDLCDNLDEEETPVETKQSTAAVEWDVRSAPQTTFDFTSDSTLEETHETLASTENNEEPEVIRHQLDDEAEDTPKSYRIQSTVLPEEQVKRSEERAAKIQEITSKIQNAENISEYETQPAYLRRDIEVQDEKPSEENNVSRFGLSSSDQGESGLRNNSYLHDNVD